MRSTRRAFVKWSSAAGAALAASHGGLAWGRQQSGARRRLAAIGVGGSRGRYNRGGTIARQAAQFADLVAVCDVDEVHAAEFRDKFDGKPATFVDYRELLEKIKPDVVTIGTPDHWHVPIAIAAMKAGCDVYCEKPLTLTIDEGKQICRVAKETGRVFQVGTQQRSEYGGRFLKAVAMVQEGFLGDHVKAHVAIGGAPAGGPFQPTTPPDGLHWDFWVGPAPAAPYCDQRRQMFRWFLEYSGGKMTDWGAHHIDIAQWAIGCSDSGPIEVSGTGTFPPVIPQGFDFRDFFAGRIRLPHAFNAPVKFDLTMKYANGSSIQVTDDYASDDGKTKFGNGILFEGDKGRIFVNRGKLTGTPVESLSEADEKRLEEAISRLYHDRPRRGHMADFFACVESRQQPVSDVFTHHRTMTACHLCNIALQLGRTVRWDPKGEQFPGDNDANALMKRPSRPDYLV